VQAELHVKGMPSKPVERPSSKTRKKEVVVHIDAVCCTGRASSITAGSVGGSTLLPGELWFGKLECDIVGELVDGPCGSDGLVVCVAAKVFRLFV